MKYDLSKSRDAQAFWARCERLEDKACIVELKEVRQQRSNPQNAYLHVCLSIFGRETGYTLEEIKSLLKRNYGLTYEKNGETFIRSTTDLDSKEITDFIEWVRNQAAQIDIQIPSPDEYSGNWASLENQVENYGNESRIHTDFKK